MKRAVVKIGTHTLLSATGGIDEALLAVLADDIQSARTAGKEIIIVTSGAVASGRHLLANKKNLTKRACASAGQADLTVHYTQAFSKASLVVGQILISKNDIINKTTYSTLQETINDLLAAGVVPLINENDALTNGTAATFKDNDSLSIVIALAAEADLVINLSHVDGLYTKDPTTNPDATLLKTVDSVSKELLRLGEKTTSEHGSGGMLAKLRAMRLASAFGITMVIANGRKPQIISRALDGESVGTLFLPSPTKLTKRDRWLVSANISSGSLVIDAGAGVALKRGKSLLAVGIKKILGTFNQGEIIDVLDMDGDLLAIGMVKMDNKKLATMLTAGDVYNQEIIHTDSLILI